jgi:hypothetical protein
MGSVVVPLVWVDRMTMGSSQVSPACVMSGLVYVGMERW